MKNGLLHYFSLKKTNPGGAFLGSHPQGCHVGAFGFGTCWLIQALPDLPAFALTVPEAQKHPPQWFWNFHSGSGDLNHQRSLPTRERHKQMSVVSSLMMRLLESRREPTLTSSCLGPDTVLGAFLPLVSKDMLLPANS